MNEVITPTSVQPMRRNGNHQAEQEEQVVDAVRGCGAKPDCTKVHAAWCQRGSSDHCPAPPASSKRAHGAVGRQVAQDQLQPVAQAGRDMQVEREVGALPSRSGTRDAHRSSPGSRTHRSPGASFGPAISNASALRVRLERAVGGLRDARPGRAPRRRADRPSSKNSMSFAVAATAAACSRSSTLRQVEIAGAALGQVQVQQQ